MPPKNRTAPAAPSLMKTITVGETHKTIHVRGARVGDRSQHHTRHEHTQRDPPVPGPEHRGRPTALWKETHGGNGAARGQCAGAHHRS